MSFIDGKLVSDHFYYGESWWIGLKRFLPDLMEGSMYFYFRPISEQAPYLADIPVKKVLDFSEGDICMVHGIEAIPQYQIILIPK